MLYNDRLHYFAGFFDGEGCVQISRNGSVQLRIINTNLAILEKIQEVFGGSVNKRAQIVNKPQYSWSVYGDLAKNLAELLAPLCMEKSKQLYVALEWIQEREKYSGIRIPNRKGVFKNPEREVKIKEYQQRITRLMKGLDAA